MVFSPTNSLFMSTIALDSLTSDIVAALASKEVGGPMYARLATVLRDAIHGGRLLNGAALPPERDLAEALEVSRVTLRRAVEELVREGLLNVKQGSGTYVTARLVEPLSVLTSFSEDMRRRGMVAGSVWVSRQLAMPSAEEAMSLALSLSDQVMRASRVRTANGAPIAWESATVSAVFVGNTSEFGDSLYSALQRNGARPVRAIQRIRAGIADATAARLLDLHAGVAVLETERRSFTAEGKPVELTRSIYRADLYDYVVEMRVPESNK